MLSKRFRRGYEDLKSTFLCQNSGSQSGTTLNNDNGVPVTNGANGVDSNPDQAVIHTTRIPLVQVPIVINTQNRKSHSQAQLLPSHTTSHSKHSFISEPHQSQRARHLCSSMQIKIL